MQSGGLRTKGITKQSFENMPLITVVTVVRNGAETIEQTILSVINQTYQNIEYIIIDGASTDNTLDIVRKYEDKIDYWMSEPDEGIFDAMNKSISILTGDYIGFLNSGDYYVENSLEIIAYTVIKNQDIDVIYGKTNLVIFIFGKQYDFLITPSLIIDEKINYGPLFCHQSSFVNKNIFKQYGHFENSNVVGDWLFFVKLYKNQAKFFYIDSIISNYLDGGISSSVEGFKESFPYKKKLGTFKKMDYLRVIAYYLKNTKFYKKCIYPIRWMMRIKRTKNFIR